MMYCFVHSSKAEMGLYSWILSLSTLPWFAHAGIWAKIRLALYLFSTFNRWLHSKNCQWKHFCSPSLSSFLCLAIFSGENRVLWTVFCQPLAWIVFFFPCSNLSNCDIKSYGFESFFSGSDEVFSTGIFDATTELTSMWVSALVRTYTRHFTCFVNREWRLFFFSCPLKRTTEISPETLRQGWSTAF